MNVTRDIRNRYLEEWSDIHSLIGEEKKYWQDRKVDNADAIILLRKVWTEQSTRVIRKHILHKKG